MTLGSILVKLAKPLDLTGQGKAMSEKKIDRAFTPLANIKTAMLDELVALERMPSVLATKIAAVSEEQARGSLNRLDSLERNKPTLRQVGRYGTLGAVAAPVASMVTNAVRGKPMLDAGTNIGKLREVAGRAAGGAITGGAIPLLRSHLDRKAELGTLRRFVDENMPPQPDTARF